MAGKVVFAEAPRITHSFLASGAVNGNLTRVHRNQAATRGTRRGNLESRSWQ